MNSEKEYVDIIYFDTCHHQVLQRAISFQTKKSFASYFVIWRHMVVFIALFCISTVILDKILEIHLQG